jgi:hypothetical protein
LFPAYMKSNAFRSISGDPPMPGFAEELLEKSFRLRFASGS